MKGTTMHTNHSILADRNMTTDKLQHPDLETPVLSESQRQGDVLVRKIKDTPDGATFTPIAAAGVTVVRAETNTANTHTLHTLSGECLWAPNLQADEDLVQGWLTVTDGSEATLIHTEEHNVLGLGAGTYEIRRQREYADGWRRVAD